MPARQTGQDECVGYVLAINPVNVPKTVTAVDAMGAESHFEVAIIGVAGRPASPQRRCLADIAGGSFSSTFVNIGTLRPHVCTCWWDERE